MLSPRFTKWSREEIFWDVPKVNGEAEAVHTTPAVLNHGAF